MLMERVHKIHPLLVSIPWLNQESHGTMFLTDTLQVTMKLEDLEETLQKPVVDSITKEGYAYFRELDNAQGVSNRFKNHFTLLCESINPAWDTEHQESITWVLMQFTGPQEMKI